MTFDPSINWMGVVHRDAAHFEFTTSSDNWYNEWDSRSSKWTMVFAVKVVLSPGIFQSGLAVAMGKLLQDDSLADTKVVAQNGAEIKFHRSILAAHNAAFERMFQTTMEGSTFAVLEMPDMREESVRALKEYLYVRELKAPQENSLVCFELFEAGHKYKMPMLKQATSKILLSMGGAWYSPVVGLRLFLLVKDMDLPRLKHKALEILKL